MKIFFNGTKCWTSRSSYWEGDRLILTFINENDSDTINVFKARRNGAEHVLIDAIRLLFKK